MKTEGKTMIKSKFRLVNIGKSVMRGAICYSDNPNISHIAVAVTKSYIYIYLSNLDSYIWNPYEIGIDEKIYMKYLNSEFHDIYKQYPNFLATLCDLVKHSNDNEPTI